MHPAPMSAGLSRRDLLARCGTGLGAYALASLFGESATAATTPAMATRQPQFPAKAKHVIHIFMNGGWSHVDTFDPKPALQTYAGREIPTSLKTERKTGAAYPCTYKFAKHGESGIEVSDIFPHLAGCVDDLTVVRSMYADLPNHEPSLMLMNCGDQRLSRPSVGSWLTYGLGTENQNLPGFVVLCPGGYPISGADNWRSAFLPGVYQGMHVDPNQADVKKLIEHIRNPHLNQEEQRRQLDLLQSLNRRHAVERNNEGALEARIESFEIAYRMQMEATDAFDVTREPKHIQELYGPGVHARQCLIARRLVERGVRYVQLWHGAGQPWDNHDDIAVNHRNLAQQCDQGIAALLIDLKRQGLLDETLVLIGGEFGRTPTVELPTPGSNAGKQNGRDHNHYGFTVLMAGGGVKKGYVHGATDEFGFKAVENRMHVHDLHATMLHLLGFDHEKLTYRFAGRDFRLTDVEGHVVHDLIA